MFLPEIWLTQRKSSSHSCTSTTNILKKSYFVRISWKHFGKLTQLNIILIHSNSKSIWRSSTEFSPKLNAVSQFKHRHSMVLSSQCTRCHLNSPNLLMKNVWPTWLQLFQKMYRLAKLTNIVMHSCNFYSTPKTSSLSPNPTKNVKLY